MAATDKNLYHNITCGGPWASRLQVATDAPVNNAGKEYDRQRNAILVEGVETQWSYCSSQHKHILIVIYYGDTSRYAST